MAKSDERRGKIGTVVIHAALLLLFIFFGLSYTVPPPENGIAINFGYEAEGAGESTTAPIEQETPAVQETQPDPVTEPVVEEVTTQEMVEAPAVSQEKPTETAQPEPVVEEPKPDNALSDRLSRVREGEGTGEGETEGGSDQGDPAGDPLSPNRTGSGGTGNSGDYRLGGRLALTKPRPEYNCPDEGRVVVKVYVNRTGKVTRAIPGEMIPGGPSSNTGSSCLLARAREAAIKTTWQGDPSAPEQQIGFIIYNFTKR